MLHYLDDLDSKMEAMRAQLEREALIEGPWSSYNSSLGRPILDSRKFMQGEKPPAAKNTQEGSSVAPAPPQTSDPAPSSAPVLDLFSEQKT
jgi:phage-related minor tail protein